ncbi:hypothetical protein [Desulfobacca acetoxidans]|uniref:Uncharacterized protein n=1 Tax=Desulfobacca acetoxidans (strain ATCC 700848 / DSM 11109 / ASRB2) TaxID=880072 RepID=F2NFX7_DESAR|nr:hypothetical protein [Desulfobacca acetoxidans]AEB10246.1 hypothetical protein Desac_2425 [Desulfobacca acetoxidans DSM 11109]
MAVQLPTPRQAGFALLVGLMLAALLPPLEVAAQERTPPVNPEEITKQFSTLMQKQTLPPEAAKSFQGLIEIMQGATQGKDPEALRSRSRELFQNLEGLQQNRQLPPEAAELFKSFQKLMPSATGSPQTPLSPGEAPVSLEALTKQFNGLMQNQKLPPEAAGLFKGMLELMQGFASGKDPQAWREQGPELFKNLDGMMKNQQLPPEAAEMLKSFQKAMPSPEP